ncbi:MAG: AmmeMemoRadiSam system protein A [Clostridiales bacterium]|nr:AmmeMemoRadiSam system protein A [Clostridiales bacterium]MCF8022421.1 AmmeMemoRadiSam system protein A [Clostridiales bacterium]
MAIVFCGTVPHPPIAVPEVGRGRDREIKKTQDAVLELGKHISESAADVLIIITPHGPLFSDAVGVYDFDPLVGDLEQFGAPSVCFKEKNHRLGREIVNAASLYSLPAVELDASVMQRAGTKAHLDHGVMVPLYFLKKTGVNLPLVVISMGLLPYEQLYEFGKAINQAANSINVRAAVVASGDLSHRLTVDAPAGYDPSGAEFDEKVVELIGKGNVNGILNLEPSLIEKAGECGLRPIIMSLGALDGMQISPRILSYQGPFGVGYMVADFGAASQKQNDVQEECEVARLARDTLEDYVRGESKGDNKKVPKELFNKKAGVFVSIKKHGHLRGCIGTIEPVRDNIAEEVRENSVSAGTRDPRFTPVVPGELSELEYSVDILGEAEPVETMDKLDPKKYGVIVRSGARKGVLLPDLEGIDTAEKQVSIAMQKAGIAPGEKVEVERFEVYRYK